MRLNLPEFKLKVSFWSIKVKGNFGDLSVWVITSDISKFCKKKKKVKTKMKFVRGPINRIKNWII